MGGAQRRSPPGAWAQPSGEHGGGDNYPDLAVMQNSAGGFRNLSHAHDETTGASLGQAWQRHVGSGTENVAANPGNLSDFDDFVCAGTLPTMIPPCNNSCFRSGAQVFYYEVLQDSSALARSEMKY